MDVVLTVVALLLPVVMLWRLSRVSAAPADEAAVPDMLDASDVSDVPQIERLYMRGDGEAVRALLDDAGLYDFVPKATALGLYAEALEAVAPALSGLSVLDLAEATTLVNAAEPLTELGRFDEALEVLQGTSPFPLVEAGRRCARAWALTLLNRHDEALATLRDADVDALLDYRCEYWLTLAFVQRNRNALDDCEAALHAAAKVAVRASSRRNLEFQWAELHRARGDVSRALAHYEAAARHPWRWQGGAGLLSWGTLLAGLGRHDEARAAWAQCASQDPQSLAAGEAKRLLSSSEQAPASASRPAAAAPAAP